MSSDATSERAAHELARVAGTRGVSKDPVVEDCDVLIWKGTQMVERRLDSRGAVLRRWREVKGLKQAAISRALDDSVGEPAISQWESGHRPSGPTQPQVEAIDRRFAANGCFSDMYAAVRTPTGLDADCDWFHNFQGTSGPCWGWVRTGHAGQVNGHLDVGPFRLEFEVPPGDGVFIQSFAFASNPAVHVHLETPGWVDFGRGLVPNELGVPVVVAVDYAVMGPGAARDPAMSAVTRAVLEERFGRKPGWFEEFKATAGRRVEVGRQLLTRTLKAPFGTSADLTADPPATALSAQRWSGDRYARLREARGLSLVDAADLATQLDPGLPHVTKDHVHRLEQGSTPRVPQLIERLDMVYRADGRSCTVQIDAVHEVRPGHVEVRFPSYWIGPVWVQFLRAEPGDISVARLTWRPWRKHVRLVHDAVVTCRRSVTAAAPLAVDVPQGWRVTAGVGVHPKAIDVNEGWGFVDPTAAKQALTYYYEIVLQAIRGAGE